MPDDWIAEEDIKPLIDLWCAVNKNAPSALNPGLFEKMKEVLPRSKTIKGVKPTYLKTADLTRKLRVAEDRARVCLVRYFTIPDHVGKIIYEVFDKAVWITW